MPNISPPRGEAAMLKRRREKTEKERGIIVNTFGFGYSLDTKLLRELAQTGMGSYAFIPDASLVGTMFVNALANTLVSIGTSARLSLKCTNGATFRTKGNEQLRMQSTPEEMTDKTAP